MALPHKSIPLTRSSRAPPWHDSIVRGAPDRRSPHFSTITTSHRPPPPSQSLHSSPKALPPFGFQSVVPPPYYPMPPTTSSPLPPSPRPEPSGPFQWHSPCQPHLPFRFPVNRLHWSRHSLSPPMPLLSVIRPPDQYRPRTPYRLRILHSPCPQLPPHLTHKTPPTLTH